ncbi:response regulator [Paenibacillus hexagrammi]|uniref:Response regulator transcription factor n=1 Tax=Paenibacillus hexagrammi TaxID=2908839 RepID=A0ABY3SD64_9BACL|nr:response regulator transcription factor [Paenibacillus sp. YPD9-1]UJF31363.1 response regulator transcription factor [Paenibacillus sp. YPD9-1]
MIKVVLIDNQRLLVEGIKSILEKADDIQVAGFAFDTKSALQLCQQHQPEVVILDIHMQGVDGIALTGQIHKQFPQSKIIILTGRQEMDSVVQAMNQGACGYMLKHINPDELIMTVRSTALGLSVMHKEVLVKFTRSLPVTESPEAPPAPKLPFELTEREIDIIKHVVEGRENMEIAKSLFLSLGTVKKTLSIILKKVDVKDRVELAVYAMKNNII